MKNYTSEVPAERKISKEQLIKNLGTGMLGKKHSEETKFKIGKGNKGKRRSKETRAKMSRAGKGVQSGERHPNWKGGEWKDKAGRIYVYFPKHIHSNNKGYIFKSRLIMENILGRILGPEEIVHHINKIPSDNRPENLALFPSKADHTAFHNRTRKAGGFKLLGEGKSHE